MGKIEVLMPRTSKVFEFAECNDLASSRMKALLIELITHANSTVVDSVTRSELPV